MDSKKIGAFIAALRKEKCMTQRELADKLNITDKAISKWETGEGYPEITIIPALAEILGVKIDELFKGERLTHTDQPLGAQLDYLLTSSLVRFKNLWMASLACTALGLIVFFTLTMYRAWWGSIGFGIQLSLVLASGLIYVIAKNQLIAAIAKAGQMDSDGQHCHVLADTKIYLMTSVWAWMLTVFTSAPYAIFQRSFIAFQHYLVMLPIILICGVIVTWIIHLLLFKTFSRPTWLNSKVLLWGLGSDWYLILAMVPMMLKNKLTVSILLLGYIGYTMFMVRNAGSALGTVGTSALALRNWLVAFLLVLSVQRNNHSWYERNTIILSIDWTKLAPALWLTLALGCVLLLGVRVIEERANRREITS